MKRKRAANELFEVFKPESEKKNSRSWWTKKSKGEPQPSHVSADRPASRPRATRRDATTPPGRVTLTFRREALIFAVVIGAALLLGAFAVGYSRGTARQIAKENAINQQKQMAQAGNEAQSFPGLNLSVNESGKRKYTLRLLTGLLTAQHAQTIANDLIARGYKDAFVGLDRNSNKYTLNVGRYDDWNSKDAQALKKAMQGYVYNGKKWFDKCSWQELPAGR